MATTNFHGIIVSASSNKQLRRGDLLFLNGSQYGVGCRGGMNGCLTGGRFASNWERGAVRRDAAVTPGASGIPQLRPSAVIFNREIKQGDAAG